MKGLVVFSLALLLSACGCQYNPVVHREVMVAPLTHQTLFSKADHGIDVTEAQTIHFHD
jgi:hypothetical protein